MKHIKIVVVSLLLKLASLFVRRQEKVVAFGSWSGELYSDNSKYFFEYLMSHCGSDWTLVWVGNESIRDQIPQHPNVRFVVKDSWESFRWLLKAKYLFCTQMHRADLSSYNVFSGSQIIYFDHGIPGIKKWAQDALDYNGEWENRSLAKRIFHSITGESYPYSYFTISAPKGGETYITALAYRGCSMEKLMRTGLPRNDNLIQLSHDTQYIAEKKKEYAKLLGFDCDKKVILYLPTFRRMQENNVSFLNMSPEQTEKLEQILKQHNAVLLEKNHFVDIQRGNNQHQGDAYIKRVSVPVDLQEMYLFTDIVISDYSSCYLDFILLDKPVIQFVYDAAYYADVDSGLYFPIEEFAAGRITQDFDQTIEEMDALLSGKDLYVEQRNRVKKDFLEYETGNACEKIYDILWGREKFNG